MLNNASVALPACCPTAKSTFVGEPWRHAVKAPYAGLLVCGACGIWDWRHEDDSLLEKPRSGRKKQTTQTVQESTAAQQNSLALMPEPVQQAAAQSAELLQSASAAAFYSIHSNAQLRQPETVMLATYAAHAAHSALRQPRAVQMGAQTGVMGSVMLGCSSEVANAAHTGTVSIADNADLKSSHSTDAHGGNQSFSNDVASVEDEQLGVEVKPDTVLETGGNNEGVKPASVPAAAEEPAVDAAATSVTQNGNSTAVKSATQDLAVESSAGVQSTQGRKRAAKDSVVVEMHVKRFRNGNNSKAWNHYEGADDHHERPSLYVDPMQLDSGDDNDHSMRRTVRRRARAL